MFAQLYPQTKYNKAWYVWCAWAKHQTECLHLLQLKFPACIAEIKQMENEKNNVHEAPEIQNSYAGSR